MLREVFFRLHWVLKEAWKGLSSGFCRISWVIQIEVKLFLLLFCGGGGEGGNWGDFAKVFRKRGPLDGPGRVGGEGPLVVLNKPSMCLSLVFVSILCIYFKLMRNCKDDDSFSKIFQNSVKIVKLVIFTFFFLFLFFKIIKYLSSFVFIKHKICLQESNRDSIFF